MTAVCSCTVVSHPAGEVWVTHTTDNTCDQHRHGQRYEEPK